MRTRLSRWLTTTWAGGLALVLVLLAVLFGVWTLFAWWLAMTIIHPLIDVLRIFLIALNA